MSFYDRAFIDVRRALGVAGSSLLIIDAHRAAAIESLCANSDYLRGAVLYFAPGEYVLIASTINLPRWVGDLTIPENITVWFDPGAMLVLADARLVINGGIHAPAAPIFHESHTGMVIFGGEPEALLPEWWGAIGDPEHDDAPALQHAIDAGSARRMPGPEMWLASPFPLPLSAWGASGTPPPVQSGATPGATQDTAPDNGPLRPFRPGGGTRRPIPVLLQRMYSVSSQLVMGRPISAMAPRLDGERRNGVLDFGVSGEITTSLVGLRSGALGPTAGIQASRHGFAADSGALLLLDLAFAARISNLAFDGRLLADIDLAIFPRNNLDTTAHAISIRGCSFRGARQVQVQLGPRRMRTPGDKVAIPAPDAPQSVGGVGVGALGVGLGITKLSRPIVKAPFEGIEAGTGDTPGFSLDQCTIECNVTDPDGDRTIARLPPRGMVVRASNGVAMRVAECAFHGISPALIDVSSGMLLIDRCRFDNNFDVVGIREAPPPSVPTSVGDLGFEEPRGVDVYLGAEGAVRRVMDVSSIAQTQGYVALTSCRSSSTHSMFGTPRPTPLGHDRPVRSNLILGCVHEPARVSSAGANHPVVSVRWGRTALTRFAPANRTSTRLNSDTTLCVVGSRFGGDVWIDHGAAQSVFVACRVRDSNQLPLIQTASGEQVAINNDRRPALAPPPSRVRTVVFGLQYIAVLLMAFIASGCHRAPLSGPDDASADTQASITDQPQGRLDAGGHSGVDASDVPRPPSIDRPVSPGDAIPRQDVVVFGPDVMINEFDIGYDAGAYPPRDVIQRDIEVHRVDDVAFVTEFSAPTQMRAQCPEVRDGEVDIAAPRLVFPLSAMRVTSQRPTLIWSLPPGVDGARIEICRDRCCTQPILTIDTTGTSVRPPEALSAGVVFWRARGRVGARFGRATSFTWEFGVKHRDAPTDTAWGAIKDFNGDGYDDLVNSFYSTSPLQTRIYWGGRGGIEASRFQAFEMAGTSVYAYVGDFNGDGLADAAVEALGEVVAEADGTPAIITRVFIIYGGRNGGRLSSEIFRLDFAHYAVGDFNGDGFSDLAGIMPQPIRSQSWLGEIAILFGGPDGLGSGGRQRVADPEGRQIRAGFWSVGASGDVNGDGYGDLVASDYYRNDGRGVIYVFRGARGGVESSTPHERNPESQPGFPVLSSLGFGRYHGGVGDLDGDRLGDYLVANGSYDFVDIHHGSREVDLRFNGTISSLEPDRASGPTSFGARAKEGPDLDGDGRPELVLSCSSCGPIDWMDPDFGRGRVYVYSRSFSGSWTSTPLLTIRGTNDDGWNQASTFGIDVSSGDYDGDGFDDLAVGDPESDESWARPFRGKIHLIFGGSSLSALRRSLIYGEGLPANARRGVGGTLADIATMLRLGVVG